MRPSLKSLVEKHGDVLSAIPGEETKKFDNLYFSSWKKKFVFDYYPSDGNDGEENEFSFIFEIREIVDRLNGSLTLAHHDHNKGITHKETIDFFNAESEFETLCDQYNISKSGIQQGRGFLFALKNHWNTIIQRIKLSGDSQVVFYLGEKPKDIDLSLTSRAMIYIEQYGQIDGEHHKAWVLDQVARILQGADFSITKAEWRDGNGYYQSELRYHVGTCKEYEEWVKEMKSAGENPNAYSYNPGIAP